MTQYVYVSDRGDVLVLPGETRISIRRRWPPAGGADYANYRRTSVEVPAALCDADLLAAAQQMLAAQNDSRHHLEGQTEDQTEPHQPAGAEAQTANTPDAKRKVARAYDVVTHDLEAHDHDPHDQEHYDRDRYDTG